MNRMLAPEITDEISEHERGTCGHRTGREIWWFTHPCSWALAAAMVMVGCSANGDAEARVYPVKGTITLDGEPATGAFVVFHPRSPSAPLDRARRPSGQVQDDGTFQLTTHTQADGAPAGEYAVTVQWNKLVTQGSDAVPGPNVIPLDYTRPETTPIRVTINETPNQLPPFQITRKKKS